MSGKVRYRERLGLLSVHMGGGLKHQTAALCTFQYLPVNSAPLKAAGSRARSSEHAGCLRVFLSGSQGPSHFHPVVAFGDLLRHKRGHDGHVPGLCVELA